MRIGVDISQVVYGTGVSIYTRFLFKNLLKIDSQNEYLFIGGTIRQRNKLKSIAYEICSDRKNCTAKIYPISPKIADLLFNRIHFVPIELLVGKLDVFHSSDWSQPKSSAFKVTTIHDLAPIFLPQITPQNIIDTHKKRLMRVYKEVDRIIVPSNFTKNELLRLGFPDEKIKVIYEAPGEIFFPRSLKEVIRIKKKYKINGKFILSVGVGKRKNTQSLIKAYELSKAGKDITLVIAGDPEDKSDIRRGVRYVGMLPDLELATLYTGAEALVYPSLYEGFGLPVLQAFACKCPVVTSNVSSMPEIAGNAAILVDPKDTNSIADGIKKALSAPKTYKSLGEKRVKEFSWEKAALETLNVYKEVLKG